jgi:hypothetical protein
MIRSDMISQAAFDLVREIEEAEMALVCDHEHIWIVAKGVEHQDQADAFLHRVDALQDEVVAIMVMMNAEDGECRN